MVNLLSGFTNELPVRFNGHEDENHQFKSSL